MGGYFEISNKKEKLKELKEKTLVDDFWSDTDKANLIYKEISNIEKIVNNYEELNILAELLETDYDELEYNNALSKINELEINTLLNNEYDQNDCYLEVHPGAGGTESCDWASMLLDMYTSFCDKSGFKFDIIYKSAGEEAGIKSAIINIKGLNAFGYLKNETGIHRLVRISPFDSNKRRHTSFASVSVTPELDNEINIDIKEDELKIDVYRSSGAGGQSVNTTDSAVRITHLPTKTVVTCQNERSQLKNKEVAMKILRSKLYELEKEKQDKLEQSLKDNSSINFGSQIRSYFLEPYKLVKDHRSNYESFEPLKILDGNILSILEFNLKNIR